MNFSECIAHVAECFGLDDCCMQKVLRVEEGEFHLWKRNPIHIPETERTRFFDLYKVSEDWKSLNYTAFNSRIHEEIFSKISIFSLLCRSTIDRDAIMFLGSALLMDDTVPKKVSNTTVEYMASMLNDFKVNCPNDVTAGEREISDDWVHDIVHEADELGKLLSFMVYSLLGDPRRIYLEALMKGVSQIDPNEHPDIIPAILMAALHPDFRVQDWVIQCADGSDCPELVIMLETIKPSADYIESYRAKVLEQYKQEVIKND